MPVIYRRRPFRNKRKPFIGALSKAAAGNQNISADASISTWAVAAVTVVATVSIAAGSATATWTVPSHTISATGSISAGSATASWTVPSVTYTPGTAAISASSAVATWTVPAPVMTGGGGVASTVYDVGSLDSPHVVDCTVTVGQLLTFTLARGARDA
jgi:hypothetical protein